MLFRVILKPNPKASKVLFFLTSYRAPWFIYLPVIKTLHRKGYEVVVYDFKNQVLDNDDPMLLPAFVTELNRDIQSRVIAYQKHGITIFDGVGNSLGSYLLYNYSLKYPLRRVALNTVSYMSHVIFTGNGGNFAKIRGRYIKQGYDLEKLQEQWKEIDSPSLSKNLKIKQLLIFTVTNDNYISIDSANQAIQNMQQSKAIVSVVDNKRLGHSTAVLANAHSKRILKFLLAK